MGTKTRQRSPSKITQTKEKKPPTTTEHSSAQIIKQPQQKKKKRTKRRKSKPQHPQLTVLGKSCSIHGFASKGLQPERQESTESTMMCHCSVDPGNVPPKTENLLQGESHKAKPETENKHTFGRERAKHSEEPKDISSSRENRGRLKCPNVVEKRKYQAVAEYQFIYPGKLAFHCSQDNTKQHLRTIYQGKADPKPPQPSHPLVRMPHCQWEIRKSQRGNVIPEANCPVGSDFLRSARPRNPAQGLTSLTYKVNKLVLVNEKDQAPAENIPAIRAVNPCFPHLQHYSISEKAGPLTEALQRSKYYSAKKEGWGEQQEPKDAWSRFMGLRAHSGSSPRLRPVSAKEYYGNAVDQTFGRKRSRNEEVAEKEKAARNTPVDAGGKSPIAQTKSTIIIPTVSQYLSSENLSTKGAPLRWKTATQFLAEKKMPEGIPAYSSQGEMGLGFFSAVSCRRKDKLSNTGT